MGCVSSRSFILGEYGQIFVTESVLCDMQKNRFKKEGI